MTDWDLVETQTRLELVDFPVRRKEMELGRKSERKRLPGDADDGQTKESQTHNLGNRILDSEKRIIIDSNVETNCPHIACPLSVNCYCYGSTFTTKHGNPFH